MGTTTKAILFGVVVAGAIIIPIGLGKQEKKKKSEKSLQKRRLEAAKKLAAERSDLNVQQALAIV